MNPYIYVYSTLCYKVAWHIFINKAFITLHILHWTLSTRYILTYKQIIFLDMKTKQKAVRRVPSSSCVPPLDLSLGVQHTDSESSALKRKQPVIDNLRHDHSVQNMTKKICMQQGKFCDKHMVHKTPTAIQKTTATCNPGTSSTFTSTCNNGISNLDNHHVHENSILDSTPVQSNGAKHHPQASRVSGRNQRHFPRNLTPMEVEQRNARYQTTLSTMNTSDNGGRHRKRPRFIQSAYLKSFLKNTLTALSIRSNIYMVAVITQTKTEINAGGLGKGHLQVMFPLAVAHKHANIVKLCSGMMNDLKKVLKHVQNTIAVAIMMSVNKTPEEIAAFNAAVAQAVEALMPELRARLFEEFRQEASGSSSGGTPVTISGWLEKFGKQKPRSFSSTNTPIDAENWIAHIEKIFEVLDCRDEFKARLASYKLEGDALNWWKAYKQAKGDEFILTMTWADFRDEDRETTNEFMKRFLRLAGFLGAKAGTQEEQASHFKWGLKEWILDGIVNTEFTDVAQVANAGRNIELLRERMSLLFSLALPLA
ncbi:zinc finger, CCHC-type, Retrotransposon gag domain protein [Artemisia annua]|uniref:Zinc finger, CCHC-type, Retrotransposon gag domain protein n=1 Tax=Artemisia annua TaxID=35608 RepID=A0A2U1PD79_ARTAN|nr:zinc finger, CCHC-type, Retrotransposon gag domain protein [Artemisia annua]